MSTRPIPCLPPSLLSVCITPSGESFFPFTSMQLPFSNVRSTCSGSSGASSGATLSLYMSHFLCARVEPRIFQHAALEADVEKIAIRRVRFFGARSDRNFVCLRECDHLGAAGKLLSKTFFTPRRDHLQLGRERCCG